MKQKSKVKGLKKIFEFELNTDTMYKGYILEENKSELLSINKRKISVPRTSSQIYSPKFGKSYGQPKVLD